MNLTHQHHEKGSQSDDLGNGTRIVHWCQTCYTAWDQIHQDWEAQKEYLDLIEPELVELRQKVAQYEPERTAYVTGSNHPTYNAEQD